MLLSLLVEAQEVNLCMLSGRTLAGRERVVSSGHASNTWLVVSEKDVLASWRTTLSLVSGVDLIIHWIDVTRGSARRPVIAIATFRHAVLVRRRSGVVGTSVLM